MEEQKIISFYLKKVESSQDDKQTAEIVRTAISSENLFVFSELLAHPTVLKLKDSVEFSKVYRLLEIFAYNNYSDYLEQKQSLGIDITEEEIIKIRKLSIISLCAKHKEISYNVLLRDLNMSNIRELEDLIIECIYQDIIKAKLDQRNAKILVEFAIGRDLRDGDLSSIISILSAWKKRSEELLVELNKTKEFVRSESQNHSNHISEFQAKLLHHKELAKQRTHEEELSNIGVADFSPHTYFG